MFNRVISLFLALAMVLGLTACAPKEKDFEIVPDGDVVVAKVYDTEITKQQLYVAVASYAGQYDLTMQDIEEEPALRDKLVSDFVNDMVVEYVWAHNCEQYGYEYNEAESAEFEEQFGNFLEELDNTNLADTLATGGTKDDFVEKKLSMREEYFGLMGYTEETYKEYQRCSFIAKKVKEKILQEAVDISPETVRKYYDNLLESGQTAMARNYTFSSGNPSIPIYCTEGYRYVKQLLLEFPAASIVTNAGYYAQGDDSNLEKSIARDVNYMQDTIDEIRAKLEAGTDFDTLLEEYGEDEGMKVEPYKSRGYIVTQNDPSLIPAFREACDGLTDTEMVAECATYQGYFFLQASEISGPAPMPFEEIRPELTTELNEMEKSIQYTNISTELISKLTESGDVMIDLEKYFED